MFNYGGRNGVSTLLTLIKGICRIYTSFSESIIAYVNGSNLSSEDKITLINWLNLASSACAIVSNLRYSYEQ